MEMEVICISSDDESDLQKENNTDVLVTNSTETDIRVLSVKKTEHLFADNEKVNANNLKRVLRKLQTDYEICNNTEKRKKLSFDQETSKVINNSVSSPCSVNVPKICLVKFDCDAQPNKNKEIKQDATIGNRQLIVKEKKRISYVSQDVFPLFISLCLQKCPQNDKMDMDKIVDKLKSRYENLDPIYARSEDFVKYLNEKREAIMSDNKKIYVYIKEVMNEMKTKTKKKSEALENNEIAVPSTSYAVNNVTVNNEVKLDDNEDYNENDNEDNTNPETRLKVKQVLHAMKKCEARIKSLEEEEIDFEDENNSNYIKVERYKQRMVELYNKFCELTGENSDAGRTYLRPKHLNGTGLVAVDQAITNFINSKITQRNQMKKTGTLADNLIFPDYRDILECVNRCNDRKNLGLDENKRRKMAERAFKELGEYLQRVRRADYWDTFSLYLENKEEDPAVNDMTLKRKLDDNLIEGKKRLTAVFEKYVKKQEEIKNLSEETVEEYDEDDEEEDDDEEGEEESIVDDEDKNEENVSMISEKEEDIDSEEDIQTYKTIKENKSPIKENKPNKINMDHIMVKSLSSKTVTDTLQEKSDKTVKTKILEKSDTAVSKNEARAIIMLKKVIHKPCSSNTNQKNIDDINTKTQEDLSTSSTTNCTSKDLAEVEIDVSKADHATNKATKDIAGTTIGTTTKLITGAAVELMTGDAAELMTGDAAELMTGDAAELMTGDAAELMTGDVAKLITGDMTEIIDNEVGITMDETEIITENSMDEAIENIQNDEPGEEKKPVLRLRSFAKPPTTWEDSQHKDKTAQGNALKVANQIKEIVDLTNEGTAKPTPVIAKCAVQFGDKVFPLVKHPTLVLPANRNIISVQNITNNYLKVTRTGQIISPVRGSTIIRLPSIQNTSQQNQLQNSNTIAIKNDVPLKGSETILKIIPKKSIIISKNPVVQSLSKQTNTSSPTNKIVQENKSK